MGRILGLGITDYPYLSQSDSVMSLSLQQALQSTRITAEAKDPTNWPAPMRDAWLADRGVRAAQQTRAEQVEQLRRVRRALEGFAPDYVLVIAKDHSESLGRTCIPQFWLQAHEQVTVRPYGVVGDPDNVFGADPELQVVISGHRPGASRLVNDLQVAGFDPAYSLESAHPNGLAHTFAGALVHLDWDRRAFDIPLVPLAIDPFGPRERGVDGMSPLRPGGPRPIMAARAFELGRSIAHSVAKQPYDVAVVAAAGWSHANNTSWERSWLYPDHDADRALFRQLEANAFAEWRHMTHDEMERAGQWELLCWIVLTGAMDAMGARVTHAHLICNYLFNSNWVTAVFDAPSPFHDRTTSRS